MSTPERPITQTTGRRRMAELTKAERAWIASFKRLAKKCPPTLGLWAEATGGGNMNIIATNEDGGASHGHGDDCRVYTIDSAQIACGGGDPDWRDFDDLDRTWATEEASDVDA